MSPYTRIFNITSGEFGPDLVARLAAIFPEGLVAPKVFDLALPSRDPRVDAVLGELAKNGCRPWTDKSVVRERGRDFYFNRYMIYEEADYAAAEFFELDRACVTPGWDEFHRDEQGRLVLSMTHGLPKGFVLNVNGTNDLFVPLGTRSALESQGYLGFAYRQALLRPEQWDDPLEESLVDACVTVNPETGQTYWELLSSITLPPMLPERYEHVIDGVIMRSRNPVPLDVRLAYSGDVLHAAGPFDFAFSTEVARSGRSVLPHVVVSRRLYEYLEPRITGSCDFQLFKPVRVDQ